METNRFGEATETPSTKGLGRSTQTFPIPWSLGRSTQTFHIPWNLGGYSLGRTTQTHPTHPSLSLNASRDLDPQPLAFSVGLGRSTQTLLLILKHYISFDSNETGKMFFAKPFMFRNLRRMQFDLPNEEGFAKNTLINSFA
jgi:hypothetical protein